MAQLLSLWFDGVICIKTNPNCDCGVEASPSQSSFSVESDLLTDVKETCVLSSLRPPGVLSRPPTVSHLRYGFKN